MFRTCKFCLYFLLALTPFSAFATFSNNVELLLLGQNQFDYQFDESGPDGFAQYDLTADFRLDPDTPYTLDNATLSFGDGVFNFTEDTSDDLFDGYYNSPTFGSRAELNTFTLGSGYTAAFDFGDDGVYTANLGTLVEDSFPNQPYFTGLSSEDFGTLSETSYFYIDPTVDTLLTWPSFAGMQGEDFILLNFEAYDDYYGEYADFTIAFGDTEFIPGELLGLADVVVTSGFDSYLLEAGTLETDMFYEATIIFANVVETNTEDLSGPAISFLASETHVMVQTVPEPATMAAIMGSVALAFVVYRRRKTKA